MINYLQLSRANNYLLKNDYFPRQPTFINEKCPPKTQNRQPFEKKNRKTQFRSIFCSARPEHSLQQLNLEKLSREKGQNCQNAKKFIENNPGSRSRSPPPRAPPGWCAAAAAPAPPSRPSWSLSCPPPARCGPSRRQTCEPPARERETRCPGAAVCKGY